MIIGLIPIGGKGTRLSLPYSKEMLPQKNYDHYNPVVNHLVEKMLLAGAERIFFVHGNEFKKDVCDHFSGDNYSHILQNNLGFANVIKDFYDLILLDDKDKILFGLPDSVFDQNPFVEMLNLPGIVCGLFTTEPFSKVDRLENDIFKVKTNKSQTNSDWFWGILKFDKHNIQQMVQDNMFEKYNEVGEILNQYPKLFVKGKRYLDLGTWVGYNKYLTTKEMFSNVEIEKKYDASNVKETEFCEFLSNFCKKYQQITSTDYYFTVDNKNVEFVRYRENSKDSGSVPDITIKNFNNNQLNRFELTVPLSKEASSHNVMHFMSIMGAAYKFNVTKICDIFEMDKCTIVMYSFVVKDKTFKVIEVELKDGDFNVIAEMEELLNKVSGFNPNAVIKKSKFQMVNELLNDPSH